jgi:ABC-type amino acid transport/signal transduction systems, periplasmic component/domain
MGRAYPSPLTAFLPKGAIMTTVSRFFAPLLAAAALFLAGSGAGAADPLKVSVNKDDRPFGYVDDQGQLTGFNVDLARALCRAMAADCTLTPVPFADFVPGVVEGRFDFAVANLLRTPEREQLVDFTDRIWRSSSTFVGRPGAVTDTAPEGLRGKTIAVQAGASQERYLREVYGDTATILAFPTNVERNTALATGKADLMLGSITASFMFLKSPEGATFEILGQPLRDRGLGGDVAVPVAKKRDALRQRLNAAITTILRDGTFSRINNAYFPMSVY